MFKLGMHVLDTRSNKECRIIKMDTTQKGTLYTVQYDTLNVFKPTFKRYYTDDMMLHFETLYSNVLFVDFKARRKVS